MKIGLVMEGGAMRGMFTAGVIDVLMCLGVEFDGAVGVSAGATFGCNYKSKQIGRAIRYNVNYCTDNRYGSIESLIKTGNYFNVDFCYRELPFELDLFDTDTFAKNPMEFYVVATDIEKGKAVYHKCSNGLDKDIKWIGASASVPLISQIVNIDGRKLLDGGIADSVPLKFFESIGYRKNVVILTQPDDYRKQPNKAIPLCNIMYKDYPKFTKIFANRHIRYNANIDYVRQQEMNDKAFVIRPPHKLDLSSGEKNPFKLQQAYELGRKTALEAVQKRNLLRWIKSSRS